jgi:hypothetical protein
MASWSGFEQWAQGMMLDMTPDSNPNPNDVDATFESDDAAEEE